MIASIRLYHAPADSLMSIQPDRGPNEYLRHGHYLHDIELLDEAGLEYMPHSASLFNTV